MTALPAQLHVLSRTRARRTAIVGDGLRSRLARMGPAALDEADLLALVFGGSATAAQAVARLALDGIGGPSGLARADLAELSRMPGVGPRRAAALVAAVEVGRRAAAAWPEPSWRIRAPADVGDRLLPAMRHLEREELRVLLLNTKNVVSSMVVVYVGNLAGSSVRVGEVFRDAVRRQAAAIVVVHNHPSGDPSPSADDLRITAELAEAGRLLDIELMDHIVVGAERWVSLRSLGPW